MVSCKAWNMSFPTKYNTSGKNTHLECRVVKLQGCPQKIIITIITREKTGLLWNQLLIPDNALPSISLKDIKNLSTFHQNLPFLVISFCPCWITKGMARRQIPSILSHIKRKGQNQLIQLFHQHRSRQYVRVRTLYSYHYH